MFKCFGIEDSFWELENVNNNMGSEKKKLSTGNGERNNRKKIHQNSVESYRLFVMYR